MGSQLNPIHLPRKKGACSMSQCDSLLQMININKQYPGVKALNNVCFNLSKGEVHALIGENGAGKSTLIKVLMGIVHKDSGTILLENVPVNINNANEARKLGISAVFQELSQISTLSVAENIFIKKEKTKTLLLDKKSMLLAAKRLLDDYELDIDPKQLVSELPIAKRQLVEILKATADSPKVLILDEPTSALTEGESAALFLLIERLKKAGTGMIYISHRMNEIFRIANRTTILRDGANVANFEVADISMEIVVKHMVGRDLELYDGSLKRNYKRDGLPVALEVKNLSQIGVFKNISFKLIKGEVLGIAGLVGSGRTELMQAIFGITKFDSGEIFVDGKRAVIKNVKDAMEKGIAMIPENRHLQGLILMHSIMNNISLLTIKDFSRGGILQNSQICKFVDEIITRFSIKTESRNKLVNNLSGGNQQKVVIAKWLSKNPKILIVDELTAGIDVHSKSEIHKMLRDLANNGMSIILISSEMPELLTHSDRILVMNRNRIISEFFQTHQEEIMSTIMNDNLQNVEVQTQ
jgi:ribose transport system ATP-binding protein